MHFASSAAKVITRPPGPLRKCSLVEGPDGKQTPPLKCADLPLHDPGVTIGLTLEILLGLVIDLVNADGGVVMKRFIKCFKIFLGLWGKFST
jgi:hypothetical protein